MIRQDLYNKTINVITKAYHNDTLEHGTCYGCFVGNLVAAGCGYEYERCEVSEKLLFENGQIAQWDEVFCTRGFECTRTGRVSLQQITYENKYHTIDEARKQIDSTGYTWQELAQIEFAFETADKGESKEDYMFNGLIAGIEVLDKIHQVKESKSQKFKFEELLAA